LKRKINFDFGGFAFTFLSDEPGEKIQKMKTSLETELSRYKQHLETNPEQGLREVLVLMLLNHVTKESQLEEEVKRLEEKVERLSLETNHGKLNRSEMAG
jgi:stalled ribosome rescue protein Dom34